MTEFRPTWLYIKQHNTTGLKYFGKTTQNPFKYLGSGKFWRNHINKHGNDVSTIWAELFFDRSLLFEFATFFSEDNNIVEARHADGRKEWANLVIEDGMQGGQNKGLVSPLKGKATGRASYWKGKKRPEHSQMMKGRVNSIEHNDNISKALSAHVRTIEHSAAISKAKKGIPNPNLSIALKGNPNVNTNKGKKLKTYACEHCGKETTGGNIKRWHGSNCKFKGK